MFYINNKQGIYPIEIYNRFDEKKKKEFKEITDEEYGRLIKKINKKNKTFSIVNDKIVYSDIKVTDEKKWITERDMLLRLLRDTDYKVLKCIELETTMSIRYPLLLVERQEARDRINELEILIGK